MSVLRYMFLCPTSRATYSVGKWVGALARASDVITLEGSIGAGKSVLARGVVHGFLGRVDVSVPSPTYVLDNTYTNTRGMVLHHIDAYRLAKPDDAAVLELPRLMQSCVTVVEWPQRIAPLLPSRRLRVQLSTSEQPAYAQLASEACRLTFDAADMLQGNSSSVPVESDVVAAARGATPAPRNGAPPAWQLPPSADEDAFNALVDAGFDDDAPALSHSSGSAADALPNGASVRAASAMLAAGADDPRLLVIEARGEWHALDAALRHIALRG